MKESSPVNNCYRAILAQVNYLDSVCNDNVRLKELYEDLTELAFYLLEEDIERIYKGIEQIKSNINEMEYIYGEVNDKDKERMKLILSEIKTHLHYLLIMSHKSTA